MRTLLLLGPLLVTLGCNAAGAKRIEGRWRGQRAEGVAPGQQLQANTFALGTEIVVRDGRIAIHTPSGKSAFAPFRVDKHDATSLVLHTDPDGKAETFTFDEKDETMVWKLDAQRSMLFKKAAIAQ